MNAAKSTSPRRWQFSIWHALSLLFVICVLSGLVAYYLRTVWQERLAIAEIQKIGGTIYFSHQIVGDKLNAAAKPGYLARTANLSPDYLYSIAFVDFRGARFGDEHVKHLKNAPWLRWLSMSDSRVTDAGVKEICQSNPYLERLELAYTSVTDKCLDDIAKLRQLEWLLLEAAQATPEGIERLQKKLPHCRIDTRGPLIVE